MSNRENLPIPELPQHHIARQRHQEAIEAAAAHRLRRELIGPNPIRVGAGRFFIRLGRWLADGQSRAVGVCGPDRQRPVGPARASSAWST